MLKPKMTVCALMSLLALAGCALQPPTLQPVKTPQAEVPEASAWAMQYKSTSVQKVDALFSISENQPKTTTK